MCGITGVFSFESQEANRVGLGDRVEAMNAKMIHRGPDAQGVFMDEHLALGHVRLSIVDLSQDSNQPFYSSCGRYVLVFNGELYNFKTIREELKGRYEFRTSSDTEVLLHAFQEWGADCVKRFNGMFAFAIWDKEQESLTIARDRLGIKPLYYYRNEQVVVFASEVRSLLASGLVPKKLNTEVLSEYVQYQTVHEPETLIEDVKLLEAGALMELSVEGVQGRRFWHLGDNAQEHIGKTAGYNLEQVQGQVKEKVYAAVERRLMADVPLGAFLSGGIDSSLIVGVASEVLSKPLSTFSVVFEEQEFSEAPFAQQIARKFSTDHHEILLKPTDFLHEIPGALGAMDHPSGDGPNSYVVSKVTKEAGITVALSGLGGDELFAGYDIFKRAADLQGKKWLLSFPKYMRKAFGSAYKRMKNNVASHKIAGLLEQDYFDVEFVQPISRQLFDRKSAERMVSQEGKDRVIQDLYDYIGFGNDGYALPFLSRVSYAEISTYMRHVLLRDSDQMSMAHALEIRVPFLDHELVEFALSVQDGHKYPTSPKQLLINSMKGMLPDEVVNRPKMGFTLPWKNWLGAELRDFCTERIDRLEQRGVFAPGEMSKLWQAFLNSSPLVTWSRVWPFIVLEDWMERNEIEL